MAPSPWFVLEALWCSQVVEVRSGCPLTRHTWEEYCPLTCSVRLLEGEDKRQWLYLWNTPGVALGLCGKVGLDVEGHLGLLLKAAFIQTQWGRNTLPLESAVLVLKSLFLRWCTRRGCAPIPEMLCAFTLIFVGWFGLEGTLKLVQFQPVRWRDGIHLAATLLH